MGQGDRHGANEWIKDWIHPPGPLSAYNEFPINGFDAFGEPFNHLAEKTENRIKKAAIPYQALGKIQPDGDGDTPWQKLLTGDAALKFDKCAAGQLNDISNCPVKFFKQGTSLIQLSSKRVCIVRHCVPLCVRLDGHHARPQNLGFDVKAHPYMMQFYISTGSENLFGGWHPGSLAHEVIGNQLAFFHVEAAKLAIAQIMKTDDETGMRELDEMLVLAAKRPLPANVKVANRMRSHAFLPN
jgi:hypothetical protein